MLGVAAVAVLVYAVFVELSILTQILVSALQLHHDRHVARFRRLEDLLSSHAVPPVSIVVPAYNEEAGIVEAVRSMQMLKYPRLEVIVVNDGSTDATLDRLVDAFQMTEVTLPFRDGIATRPVRGAYESRFPIPLIVVDKENGGKADAVNAGTNVAHYPYVLITDADVVMDEWCVLRGMRHVVEDRSRVVAVGGNVRPANGCHIAFGRVVEPMVPERMTERVQLLEYLRAFVGSRPTWSRYNSLTLISGAFGIFKRDTLTEVGGLKSGHLGEDLDLTMRIHRHMRDNREPYRVVYASDCVAWTEVPHTPAALRTQRIRWHRGLTRAVRDFRAMLLHPRYGTLGILGWPHKVLVEFLGPIVEFAGWLVLPAALLLGALDLGTALPLLSIAFVIGAINSLLALYLDEAFGYFDSPMEAIRLLGVVFVENLGWRQRTVWWRVRALFGDLHGRTWGSAPRLGVGNLSARR